MSSVRRVILVLFAFASMQVSAEKILFDGLEIDIHKDWEVKREYGSLIIKSSAEGYEVKLGAMKLLTETIDIMVKGLTPDDGHQRIGEFYLLKESKKFNLYEGTWDRSWSILSKDTYLSIRNVSRNEQYPVHQFVKKLVASLKWHTPNKGVNVNAQK